MQIINNSYLQPGVISVSLKKCKSDSTNELCTSDNSELLVNCSSPEFLFLISWFVYYKKNLKKLINNQESYKNQ